MLKSSPFVLGLAKVAGWLKRQWNDIKGNVKYGVLLFVGAGIVTGVTAITRGLLWWQQTILVLSFVLLFGWALVATWVVRAPQPAFALADRKPLTSSILSSLRTHNLK